MIMEAHVIRYKGYLACKNGIQMSANPYFGSSEKKDAIEWETGWQYADEEGSQAK